ncbi:hypothetical protein JXO59_03990 [candidate division KSB1 bacterium]|nr:hypothetical protein [candidate division KSB1 bacterium]
MTNFAQYLRRQNRFVNIFRRTIYRIRRDELALALMAIFLLEFVAEDIISEKDIAIVVERD